MARRGLLTVGLLGWIALRAAAGSAQVALDVPMDRSLVTVLVVLGLQDKEPTTWEGTYRLTSGSIVATDGWRFLGDDHANTSQFRFQNQRRYPLMWNRSGRDPNTFPVEPNGVVLTLAGVGPDSALELSTTRGEFSLPVGSLAYGDPQRTADGSLEYQRLPTYRQVVTAPTEDGYPAAVAGPDGAAYVAYVAFTHGEDFRVRSPVKEMPTDFSDLAERTGGEQLMFTEMRGGQWTTPIALGEPGGDLFRPAAAVDGEGRVWVIWSANVEGNWDLYCRVREGEKWSETQRVTTAPGSDFDVAAATDAQGRVWIAWQSLAARSSDILAARQEGDRLGEPAAVADGDANEWSPALAASRDGRVAVAWDTYAAGNYDVMVREWREGKWGDGRLIAGTLQNECRASAAYDGQNRLWLAYEVSPGGWGKDFGPYGESPQTTALYQSRQLGVRVVAEGSLYAPEADVNLVLPMPDGARRPANAQPRFLASTPRIAADARGNVWVSARMRVGRFNSPVGGCWMNFVSRLAPDGWTPACLVPGTDGFLHEANVLVPAPDGGLYVVSTSDGRFRAAPAMGPQPWRRPERSADAPPATTRT